MRLLHEKTLLTAVNERGCEGPAEKKQSVGTGRSVLLPVASIVSPAQISSAHDHLRISMYGV
eukprot:scaffold345007_cov19-Prasinocladus_malaysianus.AAC.1